MGRIFAVQSFVFDHALLPSGWAENVRIDFSDGVITAVSSNPDDDRAATRIAGIALPGLPNLHCHAFQRGMAGLGEQRGSSDDSFWTWREVMYRFLGQLSPDDVQAIAAFAYMEMLESGFTSVGEFHYLHHDVDGNPYADLGEMAARIAAAASATGIGLTLLPALYAHGDFGGKTSSPMQARFLNDPERFLKLVERCHDLVAAIPSATVGIAPHSLRAVTPHELDSVLAATPTGPIHIHVAEQRKEVQDCVAWSGARPVQWLLEHATVDDRWCLIHATHMTSDEIVRLAASRAVAGLCPITEASLGDGIFNGPEFIAAGGRYGVGSDSNIEIDPRGELRLLEYSQRLGCRARNVMTRRQSDSTGCTLLTTTLAGGAQALGRPIGSLTPGHRADIVVLDPDHVSFATLPRAQWVDGWIFAPGRPAVLEVFVSGRSVVIDGHHRNAEAIIAQYRRTMKKLEHA